MLNACLRAPQTPVPVKPFSSGQVCQEESSIYSVGPPPSSPTGTPTQEWRSPKQWLAASRCGTRIGGVLCSRDMSPICSDTSDAEQAEGNTWCYSSGASIAPPPPPPPPPEGQMEHASSAQACVPIIPTTQLYYRRPQHQGKIPLPPATPPAYAVKASLVAPPSEASRKPPTPPWRRSSGISERPTCPSWPGLIAAIPPVSLGEQNRQPDKEHSGSTSNLLFPLEDPYALSSSPDPYAYSTCRNSATHNLGTPVPPLKVFQQLDAIPSAATNVAVSAAATSCSRTCNNFPLLLTPPLSQNRPAPPPAPPETPGCASSLYPPMPPGAAAGRGAGNFWMMPEGHRSRQRVRLRQRREGGPSQMLTGSLTPFAFVQHCHYPPQQQQQQQLDRAPPPLRRTCYRCRRRGHEASECPDS